MVISSATVRAKHDDSQSMRAYLAEIELKLKGRGIPLKKKQLAVSGKKGVTIRHKLKIKHEYIVTQSQLNNRITKFRNN